MPHSHSKKYIIAIHIAIFLLAFSCIVLLGVITYGVKTTYVSLYFGQQEIGDVSADDVGLEQKNTMSIGVSNLPSDEDIEKIFNDIMPNVCTSCKKKTLVCLKKYTLDKTLVQGPGYAYLIVDLTTKSGDVYTITLDHLRGHQIIGHEGSLSKKSCRDEIEEEEIEIDESILLPGSDDDQTSLLDIINNS